MLIAPGSEPPTPEFGSDGMYMKAAQALTQGTLTRGKPPY